MPIYKLRNLKSGQAMLIPMGEFVVGRAEGSDLPIDDLSISRRHARIINIDSGLFVEDSGSANGTSLWGIADHPAHGAGKPGTFCTLVPFRCESIRRWQALGRNRYRRRERPRSRLSTVKQCGCRRRARIRSDG